MVSLLSFSILFEIIQHHITSKSDTIVDLTLSVFTQKLRVFIFSDILVTLLAFQICSFNGLSRLVKVTIPATSTTNISHIIPPQLHI